MENFLEQLKKYLMLDLTLMEINKEKHEREIVSEVFIMSIIHQTARTE